MNLETKFYFEFYNYILNLVELLKFHKLRTLDHYWHVSISSVWVCMRAFKTVALLMSGLRKALLTFANKCVSRKKHRDHITLNIKIYLMEGNLIVLQMTRVRKSS